MNAEKLAQQLVEAQAKRDRRLVKLAAHFDLPHPNSLRIEQQIQQDYIHEVRVLRRAGKVGKSYAPTNVLQ